MFKTVLLVFSVLVKFSWNHSNLYEGDICTIADGGNGTCVHIRECREAVRDLMEGIIPKTCSFSGNYPIVCCMHPDVTVQRRTTTLPVSWDDPAVTSSSSVTTTTPTPATMTTTTPTTAAPTTATPSSDTKFLGANVRSEETSCPPIPPKYTAPKTGSKAWDKCIEYQEKLVFPCEEGRGMRINNCWNDINTFIIGGTDTFEGEFPHMALIGYADNPDGLTFLCGGTLISEKYVLTAGHCSFAGISGGITHVLLGVLKRSEYNSTNLYKVAKIHKHPDYTAPVKYNDIALLETEIPVALNEYIVPACLDVADALVDGDTVIATGWGVTNLQGNRAEIMQKVTLTKFSTNECSERFKPTRLQRNGFDPSTQLCFGSRKSSSDTCQGDSGGPIQVKNKRIHCMYTVVGITSFGRSCGIAGEPALYTKVAHYIPWIESIVWPDQ